MNINEIKERYSVDLMNILTERDKSGRGFVCPLCGSGTGKNGTGMVPVKNKPGYYHCFASGCEFHGDVLELIGRVYNLRDTTEQIRKAGELLHVELMDHDPDAQWWREKRTTSSETSEEKTHDEENKNHVETNNELSAQIRTFISESSKALTPKSPGMNYLNGRGISYELASKYSLGYCGNYNRDGMNTPAIIIPTSADSYTARSMTANDSRKIRKLKAAERAGIFNIDCLNDPQFIVYIVEGEIDALSIISAGCQAIATGGGTGKRALVEELSKRKNLPTRFVILPDNDRKPDGTPDRARGYQMGKDILGMLHEAGIPAKLFDTGDPKLWPAEYKDVNDFLVGNRQGCISFLQGMRDKAEGIALGRTSVFVEGLRKQIAGGTPPITTGFSNLDDILDGGFHAGLIIVGAVSALGKTTFLLNVADLLAGKGHDILFFSLEMSRYELISKIISRRTALYCSEHDLSLSFAKSNYGISDYRRWERYNNMEREIVEKCFDDYENGAGKNIYVHHGIQDIGTDKIRKIVQNHINQTGRVPIIMIDYLQILASPDNRMTDKQKTDCNVVEAKRISRDFNTPLIGISSFNRENYQEPVSMSSFKESGSLEYSSDLLIGLQYDGMDYIPGEKAPQRQERLRQLKKDNDAAARSGRPIAIELKVLKNRSGAKGTCGFNYYPMFNFFMEA